MTDKPITPVIKQQRTLVEDFEVCPHCKKEIMEKSTYVDPDHFVYHRPCQDKGPIDKIKPMGISWTADGFIIPVPLAAGCKKQFMKKAEKTGNETSSEYFGISTLSVGEDFRLFRDIINQGIDSHLEGFTKSIFERTPEGRLSMRFHRSELPLLIRRLMDTGTEEGELWAEDIKQVLTEEEEEKREADEKSAEEGLMEKTYQDLLKQTEAKAKTWLQKRAEAEVTHGDWHVRGEFMYSVNGVEYEFDYSVTIASDPHNAPDSVDDLEPTGFPNDLPEEWVEEHFDELRDAAIEAANLEIEKELGGKPQFVPGEPTRKQKTEDDIIEDTVDELMKGSSVSGPSLKDPNVRLSLALKKAMLKVTGSVEQLISNISEYSPQQIIAALEGAMGQPVEISADDIKSGALMTLDEGKLKAVLEILRGGASQPGFGAFKGHGKDGVEYQQELRKEWER